MRYHIEWVHLAEDNVTVLYDEAIKDWNLTFFQATALARRMGYKKYGDWAYQVNVTALDKCGSPEDKRFYRHLDTQGRLL